MKTLEQYCKKKKITAEDFAKLTGISIAQIYLFYRNPNYNIKANTAKKIFQATKKKFGEGLDIWSYININIASKAKKL